MGRSFAKKYAEFGAGPSVGGGHLKYNLDNPILLAQLKYKANITAAQECAMRIGYEFDLLGLDEQRRLVEHLESFAKWIKDEMPL